MAGNYKRYTMYLPPEDIDRLKEVAADFGLSQAETGCWKSCNVKPNPWVLDMVMAKYPDDYPSPDREPPLKDGTYYVLMGAHADNAYVRPRRFRIENKYVAAHNTDYGFE